MNEERELGAATKRKEEEEDVSVSRPLTQGQFTGKVCSMRLIQGIISIF